MQLIQSKYNKYLFNNYLIQNIGESSQKRRVGMAILWESTQQYPNAFVESQTAYNNIFHSGMYSKNI